MLECSAEGNQQMGEQLFKELTEHLEAIDPERETLRYAFSEGLIGLMGDASDPHQHHIVLGQLSLEQVEKLANFTGINQLLTNDERLMLQKDAIQIGKLLIDYIIRRYAFKNSQGKQVNTNAYFAQYRQRVAEDKLRKEERARKRREAKQRSKSVKGKLHAASYAELTQRSLKNQTILKFLVNFTPPTTLGAESGID